MSWQELYNLLIGLIIAFGGWIFRVLWESIKELQKDNKELTNKINSVEVIVAGDYVKKSYFESKIDALFNKLDDIRDLIDTKADKS